MWFFDIIKKKFERSDSDKRTNSEENQQSIISTEKTVLQNIQEEMRQPTIHETLQYSAQKEVTQETTYKGITPSESENIEIEIARFIVEKTHRNLFLTGKAGTGKTTFLRDIKGHTKKKLVVLAPTGIAAVNAGAMTIHSFFQFGFGPYIKGVSMPEANYSMRKAKIDLIRELELIIIDEISMVRADLLDQINDKLQSIRRNHEPFGGVQVLMIGDLRQLPPVTGAKEGNLLKDYYESMYFFDSKVLRNSAYDCIELGKVYRQSDQHFIDILNRVRTGEVTKADIDELNSRYDPLILPGKKENNIQLVTHNRLADSINERNLATLPYEQYAFDAKVSGDFPETSFPTSRQLLLKTGAQVMFIRNDNEKGVVNGTLGKVKSFDDNSVWVQISGTDRTVKVEPVDWENISYRMDEKSKVIESKKIGSFKQFPLKAAWAITIHKSQGLTFDKAIIDAQSAFSPGQAYVALSRCRTLEGVTLSSRLSPSVFITDNTIDQYLKRIHQDIEELARDVGYEHFDYDRSKDAADDNAGKVKNRLKNKKESVEIINMPVYDALKKWRYARCKELGISAFCILTNRCMAAIANCLPKNETELLKINGIGPAKVREYGKEILDIIRSSQIPS